MRHSSTALPQPTTRRTLAPPAPDSAMSAPPRERVAALHGVMTGLANIVNEQLGRLQSARRPPGSCATWSA